MNGLLCFIICLNLYNYVHDEMCIIVKYARFCQIYGTISLHTFQFFKNSWQTTPFLDLKYQLVIT